MSNSSAPPELSLPPYLDLPPHLSAHKYFFVCTLTVAAWDTLVLSPRTWRLLRAKGWPPLKWGFYFLRLMMPIEFIIVAVAFFATNWSTAMCQQFYLFEPILTAILVSICSLIHLVRIRAIYDKSNQITGLLGVLLLVQVVMMGVSCGFYHVVPVPHPSQGCIAGPRHKFVGIYWVAPSLYFTVTFGLALVRSFQSQSVAQKPLSLWKLMLRDGLNLYGAIWIVNMINMLFWFIVTPTDASDTIRTIVTSMAAVLTITMTMRIILAIRGPLTAGGTFAGSAAAQSSSGSHTATRSHHSQARTGPGAIGTTGAVPVFSINPGSQGRQTFTLEEVRAKSEGWVDDPDGKSSLNGGNVGFDTKPEGNFGAVEAPETGVGVKVTIERQFE